MSLRIVECLPLRFAARKFGRSSGWDGRLWPSKANKAKDRT